MDVIVLAVVVGPLLVLVGVALVFLLRPAPKKVGTPKPDDLGPLNTIPTPPSGAFELADIPEGARPAAAFVLTAVSGSCVGRRFELRPSGLRIGRGPDNDVVLVEPMVSRQHAQIALRDGAWVLYDRNSINGTFIDGLKTFEKALQPGNRVQIGLSEFVYHRADAPIPATPPGPADVVLLPAAPVSRSLDTYQIEGLIGDGGMAVVHRARANDGRTVAIKIPKIANDAYLMRKFEKEGNRIGALLRGHPNIVQVECFGYARDGTPYIVMEYIDGGSLRDRLRQPLSPDDMRRIIGETCLALGFAHQHALVHRDIKPENILLTRQGIVKVADFGIAKELSGITVTHKGPVGTPEYMSPEQALGDEVQPASDIYSVGIVLYEMLTGQVPFPRRAVITDEVKQALEVVDRHIKEDPRPPQQIRPGVPMDLAAFAMKALHKDPRKRFRDGRDAAAAIGFKENLALAPPIRPAALPARLIVVQGLQRGKVILLAAEVVTVGRADVDPTSSQISRRHAVLRRRGDDFWLEDVSMNGTWINNQRVSGEQMVAAGDHIRLGESTLRLEI